MDAIWSDTVGLVFALWWVACAIHQHPPSWWGRVSRHDALQLLPSWSFFAPKPAARDDHLVFRDYAGNVAGPWREISVGEANLSIRWLWNPYRFRQKALMDLVTGLLKTRHHAVKQGLKGTLEAFSLPYLGLLSWVSAQPTQTLPCLRQFALVATSGEGLDRRVEVMYLSQIHVVSTPDDRVG